MVVEWGLESWDQGRGGREHTWDTELAAEQAAEVAACFLEPPVEEAAEEPFITLCAFLNWFNFKPKLWANLSRFSTSDWAW